MTNHTAHTTIDKHSLYFQKRKSSCVNARGIPTAAYQILHLLPEVGYPPARPHWGGGTPTLGTPHWGTPRPGPTGEGTRGGVPPPPRLAGPGLGTPPPTGVDWQTKWNYYLPSRTTYAVGKNDIIISSHVQLKKAITDYELPPSRTFFGDSKDAARFSAKHCTQRIYWCYCILKEIKSVIWNVNAEKRCLYHLILSESKKNAFLNTITSTFSLRFGSDNAMNTFILKNFVC